MPRSSCWSAEAPSPDAEAAASSARERTRADRPRAESRPARAPAAPGAVEPVSPARARAARGDPGQYAPSSYVRNWTSRCARTAPPSGALPGSRSSGFPRQAPGIDAERICSSARRSGSALPWLTSGAGLQLLLRRYLGGFGPARLSDAAKWAGVDVPKMKAAAERITLRAFRDEEGRELLNIPRAPLPDAKTPAPIRLLPTWDATLLTHCRRTRAA
jgi:hypothetical protein